MAELDYWVQLIIAIAPAAVALVGVISAIGVGIKKMKNVSSEQSTLTTKNIKDNNDLREEVVSLMKENRELREEIENINQKLDNAKVYRRK